MAQFLRPDGDTALEGWSDPSFSVIDGTIPAGTHLVNQQQIISKVLAVLT